MTHARLDQFSVSGGRSMEFSNPEREVAAYSLDEVVGVLEQAELAAREGYWSVGFVTYDAAPAFNRSFAVRARDPHEPLADLPLVWFGLFRERVEASPFIGEARMDSSPYTVSPWIATMDEDQYGDNVRRIRRLIAADELKQVNYALTLDAAISGDLYEFYRDLVLSQRGGNGAYIDLGRYRILSASPERFFGVDGSAVTVRPMKGTIPRGRWSKEDEGNATRLSNSKKDLEEHERIVDRMLEELVAITDGEPIHITELMGLERLETVWQLASEMTAGLDPEASIVDVFRTLFPSAAITGDPKLRAMETIATLESRARGLSRVPSDSWHRPAVAGRTPASVSRSGPSPSTPRKASASTGLAQESPRSPLLRATTRKPRQRPACSCSAGRRSPCMRPSGGRTNTDSGGSIAISNALPVRRPTSDSATTKARSVRRSSGVSKHEGCPCRASRARPPWQQTCGCGLRDLDPARWWPHPGREYVECSINTKAISSQSIYRFHKTTARRPYRERREMHEGVDEVLLVNERGS